MEPILIPDTNRRWDCLSLGEVMLRLDPGEGRIHTARQFTVWEGGGEYNVARGLRRCFGLRTAIAPHSPTTRLADSSKTASCKAGSTPHSSAGFPSMA